MGILSKLFKPDPAEMAEKKRIKFQELEAMFHGDKEFENNAKATWLVDRGIFYEKKEMYDEALTDFNEAINLQADHIPAHYYKAKLFKRRGDIKKAQKLLEAMPDEMKVDGRVVARKQDILNQYGF